MWFLSCQHVNCNIIWHPFVLKTDFGLEWHQLGQINFRYQFGEIKCTGKYKSFPTSPPKKNKSVNLHIIKRKKEFYHLITDLYLITLFVLVYFGILGHIRPVNITKLLLFFANSSFFPKILKNTPLCFHLGLAALYL